jgi:transposase-like protein
MAKSRMDVTAFVGKLLEQDDVDALQEGVKILAQAVMEAEVSGQIGADLYERSSERGAYRNGYRTRTWDTRLGTIELKIPKITRGRSHEMLREWCSFELHTIVVDAGQSPLEDNELED